MSARPSSGGLPVTLAFVPGLLAVFLGERLFGIGTGRTVLSGLGVAVAVGALGWRIARMRSASADRRAVEAWVSGLYGVGLLALGLYFVQSDVGTGLFGGPLSQKAPRLAVSLAALFPALLACCLLPLAMVEAAAAAMTRAPVLESGRVRSALYSGLGLAFVLVFAFASMFVATQADVTWDLSYFRTAKPGDGTRKVISISEITGMEGDVITMQEIFMFEKAGVTQEGKVVGRFRATGVRPKACDRLKASGIHLPADMFEGVTEVR